MIFVCKGYTTLFVRAGCLSETNGDNFLNVNSQFFYDKYPYFHIFLKQICVEKDIKLARFPKKEEIDKVVEDLTDNDDQPRVVILYTIQRDSHEILKAKKRHPRGSRLTFVGSLEWSNRRDITQGVEDIADGTIAFGHREGKIPEFETYFRNLRFNNYSRNYKEWIGEYWQLTYKCKLKNFTIPTNYSKECSGDEPNTG